MPWKWIAEIFFNFEFLKNLLKFPIHLKFLHKNCSKDYNGLKFYLDYQLHFLITVLDFYCFSIFALSVTSCLKKSSDKLLMTMSSTRSSQICRYLTYVSTSWGKKKKKSRCLGYLEQDLFFIHKLLFDSQ